MIDVQAIDIGLVTLGAIGATYLWRGLGVLFASRINHEGAVFQWVTCVSYAMLGGLIARMIVLPIGPLTQTPLAFRVFGVTVGLAVFFLLGRRVLLAVCAGVATFITLVSYF
jgi:branched-subunit amino acid transport protein